MSTNDSPKKPSEAYLKYSGLAFQFLAAIAIGVIIGKWLDKKFETNTPLFTALVSLFFILASLFLAVRDLLRGNKKRGTGNKGT